jgi:hypothetical protein
MTESFAIGKYIPVLARSGPNGVETVNLREPRPLYLPTLAIASKASFTPMPHRRRSSPWAQVSFIAD